MRITLLLVLACVAAGPPSASPEEPAAGEATGAVPARSESAALRAQVAALQAQVTALAAETKARQAAQQERSVAVAFVDLDHVAKDLGWLTKIQVNLQTYQNQLKEDLKQFEQHYDELVQERVKSMIPPGTKEGQKYTLSPVQSQELTNYVMAERQQVQQLDQEARRLFENYRVEWARQCRGALSPIVRQVAQEKRMSAVIPLEQTLYFDPSMDLTDAVVDAARVRPPALTEVPMPHLQGPVTIHELVPSASPPATTRPAEPTPATGER